MSNVIYCEGLPKKFKGHIAIVDGKSVKTGYDLLLCLWEQMRMTDVEKRDWDLFNKKMQDLSWIKEQDIDIVLWNFDTLLARKTKGLKIFLSGLHEAVFPYWEARGDKEINVYCVNDHILKDITSTRNILAAMPKKISETVFVDGDKPAYMPSFPVFRREGDELYLATFLTFYNVGETDNSRIGRPTMWLLEDLRTGDILDSYHTIDKEFSSASYNDQYECRYVPPMHSDRLFWDSCIALLDIVRYKYLHDGVLDAVSYIEYLNRLSWSMPDDFKRFYIDLDSVCKGVRMEDGVISLIPNSADEEVAK